MNYLTEAEIPTYCGLVSGVTMEHVSAASAMIDAYKGCSFEPKDHTEKVDLIFKRTSGLMRGKLKHFPRIAVYAVTAKVRCPFGAQELKFDEDALDFDSEESIYFSFWMPRTFLFRIPPKTITVSYRSGYNPIPDIVKRACGMLAGNIKQMGGVLQWKSRDDYDIKVTLRDEGVFSADIKAMLQGVSIL